MRARLMARCEPRFQKLRHVVAAAIRLRLRLGGLRATTGWVAKEVPCCPHHVYDCMTDVGFAEPSCLFDASTIIDAKVYAADVGFTDIEIARKLGFKDTRGLDHLIFRAAGVRSRKALARMPAATFWARVVGRLERRK
jgi:hypothetical protein